MKDKVKAVLEKEWVGQQGDQEDRSIGSSVHRIAMELFPKNLERQREIHTIFDVRSQERFERRGRL